MRGTLAERFNAKWVSVESGCHEWRGTMCTDGYGKIGLGTREQGAKRAHVVSWFLANGRWPEQGEVVRHTCDNPLCVNATHLLIGTQADNVADTASRGRHHNQRKTACKHGHEYEQYGSVKLVHGRPSRYCLQCVRDKRRMARSPVGPTERETA